MNITKEEVDALHDSWHVLYGVGVTAGVNGIYLWASNDNLYARYGMLPIEYKNVPVYVQRVPKYVYER